MRGLALQPTPATLCLLLCFVSMPATLSGELSPEEGGCSSEIDCQLNGVCTRGKCVCDAAWSGNANCSTLAFLPAKVKNGYGHPGSAVSSWGAGVQQDPTTQKWIMAVSDYALSCGQSAFPPNQQCGLAVGDSPNGPFTKNRTMIDPYCEGSSLARDPISGRWLYLHGGNGVAGHSLTHGAPVGPVNQCWNCSGSAGITPKSVQVAFMKRNNATPTIECPRTRGAFDGNDTILPQNQAVSALVSKTQDPLGEWEMVPGVRCGSNFEPWFTPNGTLYVAAPGSQPLTPSTKARCNGQMAMLSMSRAESLEAAIAGRWEALDVQYALAGAGSAENQSFSAECDICFNWEDQTIWQDKRGNFHSIAHAYRGQPNDYPVCDRTSSAAAFMNCTALGGHAFSTDGSHWYISPVAAYTPTVHYEDGSVLHLRARERPHVIIDPSSGDITHLINGAADPCPPGVNCSVACWNTGAWNSPGWNISGKIVVRWRHHTRMHV